MNAPQERCPPTEELAALFDCESGRQQVRLQLHVDRCERCATLLAGFEALRRQLAPLQRTVDVDISEAVLLRLPRRAQAARNAGARPWRWATVSHLGPRVLGGAAALAAGVSLGLSLLAGGGSLSGQGMSVFNPEPVGTLCAGLPSCAGRGR